jgi:hypothetical protein
VARGVGKPGASRAKKQPGVGRTRPSQFSDKSSDMHKVTDGGFGPQQSQLALRIYGDEVQHG